MSTRTSTDRGRRAARPSAIPRSGWRDILWRVWSEITKDRVMLIAGGVTFYVIMALFPALAAFVSLYGLVADPHDIADQLIALQGVLPPDALQLLRDQLTTLADQDGGALGIGFLVSFALAFWSANGGVKAIFEALNIAYEEEEKRSFVVLTLVSFAFTLGAMLAAAALLLAVAVVPAVIALLNIGGWAETLIALARWPILLVVIGVGVALLYRYGPSRNPARWRWISWGSGVATIVWLVASIAFSIYLQNFADYNATYGSLGALVGFLLWIWISMIILIVGAELNAEMEHQTERDTTVGAEEAMGRRGASVADTLGESAE